VLDQGHRIAYTPPFGVALAAWDTDAEQRAWLRRGSDDDELVQRLEAIPPGRASGDSTSIG
jgi:hypothetical protein